MKRNATCNRFDYVPIIRNDETARTRRCRRIRPQSLPAVACRGPVVAAAVKVALAVETALNLINQGSQLAAGETIKLWQVMLNYLVPYCVSSYSAARNELRRRT